MRRTSIKNTRINGEVQKELSRIISREIKDPRIHAMTSVTHVMVTPDLKECKAYISVLGDDQARYPGRIKKCFRIYPEGTCPKYQFEKYPGNHFLY